MKIILDISVILLLCFLLACEKKSTNPADDYLSGKWVEHVPDDVAYFAATLHSFSFNKDSFNAKIISWTDVINIITIQPCDTCPRVIDSCASNFGHEVRYIKGTYLLTNDSIYFSGKLCDSLYRNLQPTCNNIIDYNKRFSFTRNDTAIILNPDRESDFGLGIILKKE
ncbi:MAG: hypothetical protein U0T77_00160 [Chitinophagales bacterium]